MKYHLIAALYWPCWLIGSVLGYSWTGCIIDAVLSLGGLVVAWRLEFGDWTPWKD